MNVAWMLATAAAGALVGPVLRARIFRHAVPAEQGVRRDCPACQRALVGDGWPGLLGVLPPTGRCPRCRQRIGPAAGSVEVAGAVTLGLVASAGGSPFVTAALCWVTALGVALGFVDVAVHRLPDRLTLPAYVGALALLGADAIAYDRLGHLGWAVLYGLGMALCYLTLVIAYPSGMGLGDAKLALGLGLVLGWLGGAATVLGAAAGFLLAGGCAAILLALRRAGRRDAIPHGPFMLLGALAVLLLVGT